MRKTEDGQKSVQEEPCEVPDQSVDDEVGWYFDRLRTAVRPLLDESKYVRDSLEHRAVMKTATAIKGMEAVLKEGKGE